METDNEQLKQLVSEAENFQRIGELQNSLDKYSQAFDVMVAEARNHTDKNNNKAEVFAEGGLSETYLKAFREFLKRDQNAAIISNNMAVLFSQLGNKESAKIFFEQAIDLTPECIAYDDPYIGLEALKKI